MAEKDFHIIEKYNFRHALKGAAAWILVFFCFDGPPLEIF
jgi:hypothetical protein